jgi:hypothetical protein
MHTKIGVKTDRLGISPPPLPGGRRTAIRFGVIRPKTCLCAGAAVPLNDRLGQIDLEGPAATHRGPMNPLPIVCSALAIVVVVSCRSDSTAG